jgi:hypothetical protein
MRYTVRPISDRTAFEGKRQPSPFASSWSSTEELLIREVRALRGRDLVIELDLRESEIRLDGRPYARAQARTPAVRVAFDSMHGPLTYATDRFPTWQDNVRAIALGLEALRKVDRYGITKRGEQYAGWKALPAGRAMPASHMTTDDARELLARYAGVPPEQLNLDPGTLAYAWRCARRDAHPDRHGGDRTLWDQVEQAARVLGVSS